MRLPAMSFVVMVVIVACLSVPGAGQTECEAIHQCGVNQFCYTKTGFCASCIDCGRYNRYPADGVQCATGIEECGSCVLGYFEEILNRKEKRTLCKLAVTPSMMAMRATTQPNNANTDSMDINIWAYVVAGTVVILVLVTLAATLLAICGYRTYKSRRDEEQTVQSPGEESPGEELRTLMRSDPLTSGAHVVDIINEIPTTQPLARPTAYRDPREDVIVLIPTAPPSYDSLPHAHTQPEPTHSPLPPMHRASSEPQLHTSTESFSMTVDARKENALQQATPFVNPQGPYANSDDEGDVDNDGEVAGHHSPTLDLVDEETMPSSWVPERLDSDGSEREEVLDSGNGSSFSSLNDVVGSTAHGTVPNYVRNFSEVSNGLRRNLLSPEPPPVIDGRRRNLQSPEPPSLVNGRRRNRHSPEPSMTTAKKSRPDSDSTLSSNEEGEPCESDNTLPTLPQAASVNNASSAVSVMNNFTFNVHLQQ